MSGEKDDMEDEGDEAEMEMESEEPAIEEKSEVEEASEESTEDKVEENDELELDLEESEEDETSESKEEKIEEYATPAKASEGDNGDGAGSPVNANAKRPGDDSNAAPVGQKDGNTSGGSASAKEMSTGNVNVSGNSKAPAMKAEKASEGDDGANTKSVSS